MNKLVPIGLGAAAMVVVLVIGAQVLRRPDASTVGSAATPTPPPVASSGTGDALGGTVSFQMDGAPATTEVDVVVKGGGISGTAVTTFGDGTHSVRLECAVRDGDFWAVGGTVEQSTAEPASAGAWSAVIVKDGSPQKIGIWLSDTKSEGADCARWLGALDLSTIDAQNFQLVEAGALVPPPGAVRS